MGVLTIKVSFVFRVFCLLYIRLVMGWVGSVLELDWTECMGELFYELWVILVGNICIYTYV